MAPSGAPDTGPEQPPLLPPRHQDCGPDRHIPHCPTELSRLLDDARTEREALRREQIYAVRLAEAAEAECVRHATRSEELENALDAARAELMDQSDRRMDAKFYADPELLVRAEAAEARIAELEAPFHRVRPRPEGTCHRNLHYPPANSECCWDYR